MALVQQGNGLDNNDNNSIGAEEVHDVEALLGRSVQRKSRKRTNQVRL